MKYEDLIKISDPYKVYIKFKETYPCDSHIAISTRKNKKYMIYNPEKDKYGIYILVLQWKIIQNIKTNKDKLIF